MPHEKEHKMKKCLVVDDSSVIRKVARRIIETFEFEVDEAENGAIGIEKCQATMPDVILLDWNMPVMDGYDFLLNLRKIPNGDKPNVIFCTTENDINKISQAMNAGANDYIMKPFDSGIIKTKFEQSGLI